MKKRLLPILSLALALCFLAVLVAGCSTPSDPVATPSAPADNTGDDGDNNGDTPAEGDRAVFTQYWNMASHNIEDTEIRRELMAKTNCEVEYVVPQSDDGQQFTIMISSGSLPEIITTPRTNPNVMKLIEAGSVYCINDLMEEYAPSMVDDIEPEYFDYHRYSDGKNYYWTNYIYTDWVLGHETWPKVEAVFRTTNVLTEVWEAIGKPDVSSPEKYMDMLKKVKAEFPDMPTYYMQGYPANAIAAAQSEGSLFINSDSPSWGLFGEWELTQYDVNDGKVTSVIRNEKFYDMVSYLNDIFLAGMLETSMFADGSEITNTKVDNGQLAVFHGTIGNHAYASPDLYTPIPYFTEIDGQEVNGFYNKSGAGWLATMVNSKVEGDMLEAVMRFLSFQVTQEGRRLCGWGIEGRHWMWDPEDPETPIKVAETWDNMDDPADHTKKWGFWQNRAMHDQYYCNSLFEVWTEERLAWFDIYGERMKLDIFDGVRNPPMDDSAEGVMLAKLVDHSFAYYPKLVTADSKDILKSTYDEFISKCETDGLKDLEAYWTDKWALFN